MSREFLAGIGLWLLCLALVACSSASGFDSEQIINPYFACRSAGTLVVCTAHDIGHFVPKWIASSDGEPSYFASGPSFALHVSDRTHTTIEMSITDDEGTTERLRVGAVVIHGKAMFKPLTGELQ